MSSTTKKKQSRSSGLAWKPAAYMRRGVKWLLEHAGAALLLDPGLGKTSITLAAIKILLKLGVLRRVLIVAPLRVCYLVWPAEIAKWQDFQHLKCAILHGNGKDESLLADKSTNIFLINPAGLAWLFAPKNTRLWRLLDADTLVIDESSNFRNSTTRRFKFLRPYLPKFKRRWILTGSPAPNGLLGLFGQMYIVDLGRALGPYITAYRNAYFDPSGFGGYSWKIREGSDKKIYRQLKPYVLRMQAEDYLELPELVQFEIQVELPPQARRVYDDMEKELFALMDAEELFAVNGGAASIKCEQIANGAIYKNLDPNEPPPTKSKLWVPIHEAKIEAIKEFVEERSGRPTLITYQFQHDLDRLLKAFGKGSAVMGRGTSMKRTAELEREWNAGNLEIMLGQPASMGHGLNLQNSGDCVAWFSPIWDWELYDQTIRRLRRQGSVNKRIFVTHFTATNTVDRAKMIALARKKNVEKSFLDAMKTYRQERRTA